MTVFELNREQLEQLKVELYEKKKGSISYYDIVFINDLVSDDEVCEEYASVHFTNDDFWCTAGKESEGE